MIGKNLKKALVATVLAAVIGAPLFTEPSVVLAQEAPARIINKDNQKQERTFNKDNNKSSDMRNIERDSHARNSNGNYQTIKKNHQNQNSSEQQFSKRTQKPNNDNKGMQTINRTQSRVIE